MSRTPGQIAGRLYALSTAGSLFGTLVSALLLIPLVGTRRTFLLFALAIAVVAVWGLRPVRRYAAAPLAIAVLLVLPVGTLKASSTEGRVIYEAETPYQYARVVEDDLGKRTLELNEGQAFHSIYEPVGVLTGDYWDSLLVLPFSRAPSPRGRSRSWGTPPAPPRASTRSTCPARRSTASRSTPSCLRSAAATST